MTVTTLDGAVVEKKVPLPDRWLRGFAEAQVVAAGFDLRAELPAAEAVRVPAVAARGRTQRRRPQGAAVGGARRPHPAAHDPARRRAPCACPGPERLLALQRVLRHATALRVYGRRRPTRRPPPPSAWEVELPGMRLTLTLSPEASRGFSGEGGVLDALATDEAARRTRSWSPCCSPGSRAIDVADLAAQAGLPAERVRAALTRLGTVRPGRLRPRGAAYFHRELPYDADRAERHNPRLRRPARSSPTARCGWTATSARSPATTPMSTGTGQRGHPELHLLLVGEVPGRPRPLQTRARGAHGPPRRDGGAGRDTRPGRTGRRGDGGAGIDGARIDGVRIDGGAR